MHTKRPPQKLRESRLLCSASYISGNRLSTLHISPRVTLTIRLNHEQKWDFAGVRLFCWGTPLCSPILCAGHWQLFGGTDNMRTPAKGDSPSLQQLWVTCERKRCLENNPGRFEEQFLSIILSSGLLIPLENIRFPTTYFNALHTHAQCLSLYVCKRNSNTKHTSASSSLLQDQHFQRQ